MNTPNISVYCVHRRKLMKGQTFIPTLHRGVAIYLHILGGNISGNRVNQMLKKLCLDTTEVEQMSTKGEVFCLCEMGQVFVWRVKTLADLHNGNLVSWRNSFCQVGFFPPPSPPLPFTFAFHLLKQERQNLSIFQFHLSIS